MVTVNPCKPCEYDKLELVRPFAAFLFFSVPIVDLSL